MAGDSPGPLIGRGRAADVYDIGDGLVLRRNRSGKSTAIEAAVMRHVHAHGYPVPRVHDATGPDLIMDRIAGRTMLDTFSRRPWMGRRWMKLLADLLRLLEQVPIPDVDLPEHYAQPDHLVHGDLHPDNVILSPTGPIVIDWPNATLGPPGVDAASSWVIMATTELDGRGIERRFQAAARSYLTRVFVANAGRERMRSVLHLAARHRLGDRNLQGGEAEAIRRLLRQQGIDPPA